MVARLNLFLDGINRFLFSAKSGFNIRLLYSPFNQSVLYTKSLAMILVYLRSLFEKLMTKYNTVKYYVKQSCNGFDETVDETVDYRLLCNCLWEK